MRTLTVAVAAAAAAAAAVAVAVAVVFKHVRTVEVDITQTTTLVVGLLVVVIQVSCQNLDLNVWDALLDTIKGRVGNHFANSVREVGEPSKVILEIQEIITVKSHVTNVWEEHSALLLDPLRVRRVPLATINLVLVHWHV